MDSDRWVIIVDPKHVWRAVTDEVWHPVQYPHRWCPVMGIAGRKCCDFPGYRTRCRLCDVPSGIVVADPGPDHELVEPWETDPMGVADYWTRGRWVPVPELIGSLLQHNIYRRPIAKPVSKTPQPGEWWFSADGKIRVLISGITRKGYPFGETSAGVVYVQRDWSLWHHEPACTGWDWQPPQPEAEPEPLTLEQRVRVTEERLKKLEHQVSELEDCQ